MPDLPNAETVTLCGVCKGELEVPEDVLVCHDCQLVYTSPDASGDYLDPETPMCGAPFHLGTPQVITRPFRTTRDVRGNTTVQEYRTTTTAYAPCQLPVSHEAGLHHHPETVTMVTHTTPEAPRA